MKPSRAPVTFALVTAIVIYFVFEMASGGSKNTETIIRLGAIVPGIFQRGDYWRLLAAMFIHIGFLHLILNVWALMQLGSVFEALFGSVRFALTYFITGLVASCASAVLISGDAAAGASGAIFGILGALIPAVWRSPKWRHQPWTRSLVNQLVFWAGINVLIGFTVPGIDNAAHLGGLLSGLVLGFFPHHEPPPPPSENVLDVPYTSE